LEAEYIATAKNAIVAELYDRLGLPRVRHDWDSLAMVQLITELERRFSKEFDLEEIHRLRSYTEIRETLSRKGLVFENSATLPG
jgi:acyl carrier protein